MAPKSKACKYKGQGIEVVSVYLTFKSGYRGGQEGRVEIQVSSLRLALSAFHTSGNVCEQATGLSFICLMGWQVCGLLSYWC